MDNMEELFRRSPQEQERIGRNVANFTVALFGVNGIEQSRRVRLVGTGTLVTFGKSHYILTAAHVWHDAESGLKNYEATGLTLREEVDHCFPIRNDVIVVEELQGTKLDQWGPDIALLRIPPVFVGKIEAFRVFYSLEREQAKVKANHLGARILVGTPGVLSKGVGNIQNVEINSLYVAIDADF